MAGREETAHKGELTPEPGVEYVLVVLIVFCGAFSVRAHRQCYLLA
jgi:hypothetical protein